MNVKIIILLVTITMVRLLIKKRTIMRITKVVIKIIMITVIIMT